MNNKKIIFGILLFCAISFIAYTFANPLEKEEDEGKLVPGSNQVQTTPKEDDDKDKEPTEPVVVEPTEPVTDDTQNQTSTIANNNKKSIDEIAYEVIAGKWGNGTDRNNRLKNAGYDPVEVQRRVEEILASRNQGNSGNSGNNSSSQTPVIEVTEVTISATPNPTLIAGKTINLGASVSPSNATNQSLTYKSSNNNVAVVDGNGNVTAKGSGTATITITSNNGKTATFTVKVMDNEVSKITATGLLSNTIVTNNWEGIRNLTISGKVIEDDMYAIRTSIYVPKNYTTDMLKNLKVYLIGEGFTTDQVIKSGINQINDTSKISSGTAFVTYDVYFGEEILNGDEHFKIAVDWLNTGNPIIYSLDFSEMVVE